MDIFIIILHTVIIIEVQFILIMLLNEGYFFMEIYSGRANFSYICGLALQLKALKNLGELFGE